VAERNRQHIIVTRSPSSEPYTSYTTGRDSPRPPSPIDRFQHGTALAAAIKLASEAGVESRRAGSADVGMAPASDGVYVVFDSFPGFGLKPETFDPRTAGEQPALLSLLTVRVGADVVERATVFVPDGKLGHFVERFEQYAEEDTRSGKPKHANFVERIAAVRLATVEALWTDRPEDFPAAKTMIWWEVWLRRRDGEELARLVSVAERVGMRVDSRQLVFDDRVIVLVQATPDQLGSAVSVLDDLAELRRARSSSQFFAHLPVADQFDWVDDLELRLVSAPDDAPAVCVLDTGVNRGHALLASSLDPVDLHASDMSWGTHDHDGHGTEMAGLALFGDLSVALESFGEIKLTHRLESVKILPPPPLSNDPKLYAAITADAVARVEIQAPNRRRTFSMAITADSDGPAGAPTSWSAAIDALAAGREFDASSGELTYFDDDGDDGGQKPPRRLFVISAGNVADFDSAESHLDRSDLEPIEDPAQSWNALIVGGYTELADVDASGGYPGWLPTAEPGDLSPFSRTSGLFPTQWPIKPDIVMEGGNTAYSPGGDVDWPESLQVVTTHADAAQRLLTTTHQTSAATAQAAELTMKVGATYPSLWPETVRALVVHSAEWTTTMKRRFADVGTAKKARESLVRRYGFGVPDAARATRSASDALTLVLQDSIRPFEEGKLREMHVHDLPWPTEALEDLADAPVRLRVTLSYFIEPNPGRRGWRKRYRYASHGLRFDLKQASETDEEFNKRLNKSAIDAEEERPTSGSDDDWYLGPQARNRGSLHADFWNGTAAELAARGKLAIYPVTGWWKELPKKDRSKFGANYGLIVSIETPVQTADLWTPVAQQVQLPAIEIDV
jgi:hypothetical protein